MTAIRGQGGGDGARRQAAIYTRGSLLATGRVGVAKLVLARRISVSEFAEFALTLSVLQYLSLIFCDFGFVESLARMTAQASANRKGGLVRAGLVIYIPLACVFVISVLITSVVADSVFKVKIGGDLLALAPLAAVWPFSSYTGMIFARGRGRLGAAALANAAGQAVVLVAVVLLASPESSAVSMLLVVAVSNWLAAVILVRALEPSRMRIGPVAAAATAAARRWGFRAYLGRVLSMGSYNMDVLMLGALASASAVGNYTLAGAVAAASAMPAMAYANALYGHLAGAHEIGRRPILTAGSVAVLSIPATIGLTWCLSTFFLPTGYESMVALALPLGIAGGVRGFSAVFNSFLVSHGRGNDMFRQGLALTVSNLVFNFALIPEYGAQGAAWASLIAVVLNLAYYVYLYRGALGGQTSSATTNSEASNGTDISKTPSAFAGNNSSLTSRLRRVGPRPLLVIQMARHRLHRKRLDASLKADYAGVVSLPEADVELAPFPVALPSGNQSMAEAQGVVGAEEIIAAATEVMAHRTYLLGAGGADMGTPIAWHRDPKSSYVWDSDVSSQTLEITRLSDSSDAKMPWEISRSHQMLVLARAARLTGDPKYRDELQGQFEDWIASNPAGLGINWDNAMGVSIRAINWVWTLNTLPDSLQLDPACHAKVIKSLRVHARHIAANLEGSPLLRGNHYLADQVGLFVLGWALEGDPDAPRWAKSSRIAIEREIKSQILDDGLNFEASTSYHGLALELFLIPWVVAEWAGQPLTDEYRRRLESCAQAALAIRRPDGLIPLFGDNDSSRILPLDEDRSPTYDPLLWIASGVLGTPAPAAGAPAPDVAWTAGLAAAEAAGKVTVVERPASVELAEGGVWTIERGGMWLAIRCGDVGQEGTGGHSHNDALSFELSLDGVALIVDPGTFVYTSDPKMRNLFRSTAAHSTVQVNDLEINVIDESALFQLFQTSGPAVTQWSPDADGAVWSGYHDGWLRLPEQVVHSRTFEIDADGTELRVVDRLDGSGFVNAVATLRLAPGIRCQLRDGGVTGNGAAAFKVDCFGTESEPSIEEGLVASLYGQALDAQIIRIPVSGYLPLDFGVVIRPVKSLDSSGVSA
ncbi:MAG: heparinase II/III family protein [Solirubrobacterales bacterium]|nr:heparinase II/III family protein [Solirubrobacterales bacterium]